MELRNDKYSTWKHGAKGTQKMHAWGYVYAPPIGRGSPAWYHEQNLTILFLTTLYCIAEPILRSSKLTAVVSIMPSELSTDALVIHCATNDLELD